MWAWGAPRIHGELLKLGIEVSERTVSRLIPKRRTAPSQTWRTFLDNHVRDLVSIDFFTVPTARLRVLFVFIVLSHERRRLIHFNITEHPTAAWTAQQIVEAFPEDQAPRYLVRDRDGIYGEYFQNRSSRTGHSRSVHRCTKPVAKGLRFIMHLIGCNRGELFFLQVRSFTRVLRRQIVCGHFQEAIAFIVVSVSAK